MKDNVRRSSSERINDQIDLQIQFNIEYYKDKDRDEIKSRIEELDREWDIERVLEINMATVALTGIALSAFHNRKWLILPGIVLSFFTQHAIQGWCPPLPLFRRLGFRTRKEIDKEKYALMALAGDANNIGNEEDADRSRIFRAVN